MHLSRILFRWRDGFTYATQGYSNLDPMTNIEVQTFRLLVIIATLYQTLTIVLLTNQSQHL